MRLLRAQAAGNCAAYTYERRVGGARLRSRFVYACAWKPKLGSNRMDSLTALGTAVGTLLKERKQTVAVAESSGGGLINAALVAVPGASAYYLGGAIVYTLAGRAALLGLTAEEMLGI